MDQDALALLHASSRKARRQCTNPIVEFAIRPRSRRRIERRPDEKAMIAPGLRPEPQQPRHIKTGERTDVARNIRLNLHVSPKRFF
jgi:hypothetical protein